MSFNVLGRNKNEGDLIKMAISIKQLLEAGVQFGHPTRQWNPKMKQYIFVARNDTHIIDLEQTVVLAEKAYNYVRDMVAQGKTVLFVGTKKQACDAIKEEAERCGMYYVNTRWLGGTLTNFKTIRSRVERMNKLNQMEKSGEFELFPKKEVLKMKAERDKLEKNLSGIKDMTSLPGLLFVVDLKKEYIAVKEARMLGIPVVGLVDTNCDPELVDIVIPGNDDAIRSVKLIAGMVADAVLEAKNGVSMAEANADADQEVATSDNETQDAETTTKKVFKKAEKVEKEEPKSEATENAEPVVEKKVEKTTKTAKSTKATKADSQTEKETSKTVTKKTAKAEEK